MAALLLTLTLVFAAIGVRLVSIQGISAGHYVKVGLAQRLTSVTLPDERGTIFDRSGNDLAVSIPETTIWADPRLVTHPQQEAETLAPLLDVPVATLESQLVTHSQFVYLARQLDKTKADAVTNRNLPGIYGMAEPKRFDPAAPLAASLIGSVGEENTGLSGLEQEYNSILSGRPGTLVQEEDPSGSPIPGGYQKEQAPVNGSDLVLTIDEELQEQAEQALAAQIVAAKATGGTIAIMGTQTGELLAAASLTTAPRGAPATCSPTVLLAATNPGTSSPAATCPPAPTDSASAFTSVFEPGSMSKLVTISAALQDGVIVPSDRFSVPDTLSLYGDTFHDAESHPVENWSVTDILANSSNVGTINIAQHLGPQRLDAALTAYGFGQETGVGFPGESAGLLPALSTWSGTSIATIAIGQGVAVTAIQMLAAYNTIANGGVYVAPKLVAATVGNDGQTVATPASAEHRVVSPEVAAEMNTMLGEVVRVGTGQTAKISNYTVAGKTGTALIPLANARGYSTDVYNSSFAGFVPAEHPELTAIVVLDHTPLFGAVAAAPVFSTIVGQALQDFKIAPVPAQPPAPGVPLATPETAQAAGEVLGPTTSGVKVAPITIPTTVPPSAPPTTASTPPRRSDAVATTATIPSRPPTP
jgi:cell division protein FtsI (penicillin-binding protein 3)